MEDLTYKELRKKVKNVFSKYPKVKWKEKSSIINNGFPGTFNLSFNEQEHLDTFRNYINLNKPLFFAKIQPVIRPNDFELLKNSYKHLGQFEMGGISLSGPGREHLEEHVRNIIKLLYAFLITELKLDPNKVYIKLSSGGEIVEITNQKYKIPKKISKDNLAYEQWNKLGIKNFIWDKTRDTFLALFMFRKPTPWGYRNEILYDIGKGKKEEDLVDIATVEYLPWKPVFKNSEIKDITDWESFGVAMGIGMERILMTKNKFNHIVKCDHIFPLFKRIMDDAQIKNKKESFIATETLRTVHRIFTDCGKYSNLSRQRQDKLTIYLRELYYSLTRLKIPYKKIETYLELNAKLQNYYPELRTHLNLVNKEIIDSFRRKFKIT